VNTMERKKTSEQCGPFSPPSSSSDDNSKGDSCVPGSPREHSAEYKRTISTATRSASEIESEAAYRGAKNCCYISYLQALQRLKVVGHTVAAAPWIAAIPALLLVVLLIAGHLGVLAAAQNYIQQRKEVAVGVAASTAQHVALQLETIVAPNVAIATAVKALPHVPSLAQVFPSLAADVLTKLDPVQSVTRIQIIPWGIISGVYPYTPQANLDTLNYRFFYDPQRLAVTQAFVAQGPDALDIIGPITLIDKAVGFVSRMALFMPHVPDNETWGMERPFAVPYAPGLVLGNATRAELGPCGEPCGVQVINGTRWRFWGLLNTVVRAAPLMRPLEALHTQPVAYKYVLFRVLDAALNEGVTRKQAEYYKMSSDTVVFASDPEVFGPVVSSDDGAQCSDVLVGTAINLKWAVCIAPIDGWQPEWLVAMQVMISVVSVILAGLVFAMLVSQQQHSMLLELMLPKSVIRKLRTRRMYAEPFNQVTILFSDIVSYTNMSSSMKPDEIVSLLNAMYCHFDDLADKHGLFKVETIGDAFMCVGGAPERCPPHLAAQRVALMALDMVEFARSYVHTDGRTVEIRVGMYTGNVTAAVMGRKMPHWTLVGDPVNTASRMESTSLPMHIHVGPSTAALLQGHPELRLESRGELHIKGKGMMSTSFLWRRSEEAQGSQV